MTFRAHLNVSIKITSSFCALLTLLSFLLSCDRENKFLFLCLSFRPVNVLCRGIVTVEKNFTKLYTFQSYYCYITFFLPYRCILSKRQTFRLTHVHNFTMAPTPTMVVYRVAMATCDVKSKYMCVYVKCMVVCVMTFFY